MNVRVRGRTRHFRTVSFDERANAVCLVDQRALPHRFRLVRAATVAETALAIRDMTVRGAGAIGATAAYGLAQGARAFRGADRSRFQRHLDAVVSRLKQARPTAVDPVNAMLGVRAAMEEGTSVREQQDLALRAAERFALENIAHCRSIGEHGVGLIRSGMTLLTHCNAGWLAFVDIGSATAPIYEAHARGCRFQVLCDETRPRCQGASLTAWELAQQGVDHRVIADNAAGWLMQQGRIALVIVGADRVLAKTGEVANKIGTYSKAVLARRHGIPFYVAIPESTLDFQTASGREIPIEERSGEEVLGAWGSRGAGANRYVRIANPTSDALNPGFDVTPAELITGIITPRGILRPQALMQLKAATDRCA